MKVFLWAVLAMAVITAPVRSAVIAQASEIGGDVVITATGSYDISGLTLIQSDVAFLSNETGVDPADGTLFFLTSTTDIYEGVTSVPSFGTGAYALADSVSGDTFGVMSNGRLQVTSGAGVTGMVNSQMTFNNASFASLGMAEGTYQWLWSTDSLTLTVGAPAPIPVPAGLPLFLCGLGGLAALRKRA